MRRVSFSLSLIVLFTVVWVAPSVTGSSELVAQEDAGKKKQEKKKARKRRNKKPLSPAVEAMLSMAAPAAEHEILQRLVGKWNVASKMWMQPGSDPAVSKGTSSVKLILGGRFTQQDYRGTFMGSKFQGLGLIGYDKQKKKYVSVWLDTGATMIAPSEGTANEKGDGMTFVSRFVDPLSGQPVKMRMVVDFESEDRHVNQFYMVGEDGTEHKTMELIYTRKATKKKAPKEKKPRKEKGAKKAKAEKDA